MNTKAQEKFTREQWYPIADACRAALLDVFRGLNPVDGWPIIFSFIEVLAYDTDDENHITEAVVAIGKDWCYIWEGGAGGDELQIESVGEGGGKDRRAAELLRDERAVWSCSDPNRESLVRLYIKRVLGEENEEEQEDEEAAE